MSSRSLPIRLSAKARQDFVDILRFTGENWGQGQLTAYRSKIDDALSVISRNPEIGRAVTERPPVLVPVGAQGLVPGIAVEDPVELAQAVRVKGGEAVDVAPLRAR